MKSPFLRKDKEDPEVKREDKQVKRKKRLDKMSSKGKTETSRYKKLKEKVYNPFPEKTSGRRKAIKEFKKGYMDRTSKMKGTRFETKLTPEQNLAEYTRERREFYWDGKNVSLLPTDDADRPITKGIKKRNLGQNFK
jgi:hypothetical protein|tara:strand:+ start:56 stop:466 length:411 start_codon:yes stop_codon:yes gene_type:complete